MRKTEMLKLLKVLADKELKKNPEGFIDKLKEIGLDKIDITSKRSAKDALEKLISILELEGYFEDIRIEDEEVNEEFSKFLSECINKGQSRGWL